MRRALVGLGLVLCGGAQAGEWARTSCALPPQTSYAWRLEKVDPQKPAPRVRTGSFTLRPEQVVDGRLDVLVTRTDPDDELPETARAAVEAAEADGTLVEPPLEVRVGGGADVSIRNVDAWYGYMGNLADVLLPRMLPPDASPEATQHARQLVTAPGMVQGMLLREVSPSVALWCSVVARPVARYTSSRPNPLGGEPLRVDGITRYRRSGNLMTLRTVETVDIDLSALMPQPAEGASGPDPAERAALRAQLQQVAFDRTAEQVVDLSTGLTVRFEVVDVAQFEHVGEARSTLRVEQVVAP